MSKTQVHITIYFVMVTILRLIVRWIFICHCGYMVCEHLLLLAMWVICIGVKHGIWQMGKIVNKNFIPFDMGETPPSEITSLHSDNTEYNAEYVVYIAKIPPSPGQYPVCATYLSNTHQTVYTAGNLPIDTPSISIADPIQFKNRKGDVVHAFYYPPQKPYYTKYRPLTATTCQITRGANGTSHP